MSFDKPYQPKPEEVHKAIEMMTPDEKRMSRERESEIMSSNLRERIAKKEIPTYTIEIVGKTKDQLIQEIEARNINIDNPAKKLLENKNFNISREAKNITLVKLKLKDLGLRPNATTAEIIGTEDDVDENRKPAPFTRGIMTKYGLYLCPDEVALYLALQKQEKSGTENVSVGTEPIDGEIFEIYRDSENDRVDLHTRNAQPKDEWSTGNTWIFSLDKVEI